MKTRRNCRNSLQRKGQAANGQDLNRALRDEDGVIYDIVAGTFLVVGLSEDDFNSLEDDQIKQFSEKYKTPEMFVAFNRKIMVLPMERRCFSGTEEKKRSRTGVWGVS